MIRYRTKDGEALTGASPYEIVSQLRDAGKFTATQAVDEFMDGYAIRLQEYAGHLVRTDSAVNFVQDLVAAGELQPF